jgi:hypothetical protein
MTLRMRLIQALLGAAYALLACIALARAPGPVQALSAAAVMLGAYLTGRTVPDVRVTREAVPRILVVGLAVIALGIVADADGGPHALSWAAIVMAYCAGNRLRAAGIGQAAA